MQTIRVTGTKDVQNWLRHIETTFWLIAAICLTVLGTALSVGVFAYAKAQSIAPEHTRALPKHVFNDSTSAAKPIDVIGRLEIRALGLSVPITSNVETTSLEAGVGHIPGTAQPGGLGTTVLAGHRDIYLRPLQNIAKGMEIRIIGPAGIYRYIVDRWQIVLPEDVRAVSIQSRPELALVTCYPFYYIGAAPKRFIVHAHLTSLIPATNEQAP